MGGRCLTLLPAFTACTPFCLPASILFSMVSHSATTGRCHRCLRAAPHLRFPCTGCILTPGCSTCLRFRFYRRCLHYRHVCMPAPFPPRLPPACPFCLTLPTCSHTTNTRVALRRFCCNRMIPSRCSSRYTTPPHLLYLQPYSIHVTACYNGLDAVHRTDLPPRHGSAFAGRLLHAFATCAVRLRLPAARLLLRALAHWLRCLHAAACILLHASGS